MDNYIIPDLPYLLFTVKNRAFAISTGFVQEMLAVPEVVEVPDVPSYIRGVINIRGNVYKLVDMRMRLGLKSHQQEIDELIEELNQREKEHKGWLDELESCVKEDRKFTGEVDPHQCKFGRWYDSYEPEDYVVQMELRKFDQPHKAIHHTAEQVLELAAEGKKDEALEIIDMRRNGELAMMIDQFAKIRQVLHETHRDIAIIVELDEEGNNGYALAVDKVDSVENLDLSNDQKQTKDISKDFGANFSGKIAHREGSEQLVLLLDPQWIGDSI
jgi:purine-binding chemotaxis protein CheW